MLKDKRHLLITDLVNKSGAITVNDIVEKLNVSDMTVRRDLSELEEQGELKRVHGGAVSKMRYPRTELSHEDKKIINVEAKEKIAKKAAELIQEDDIIFIGPGTTMEIVAQHIPNKRMLVITNCLPVFLTLMKKNIKTYLLGGNYRKRTEAFNGNITDQALDALKFHKMFFSANGVKNTDIMTATIEEGKTQQLALDKTAERYLVMDNSKVGKEDFYTFYDLRDITSVIMDSEDTKKIKQISEYSSIILAD